MTSWTRVALVTLIASVTLPSPSHAQPAGPDQLTGRATTDAPEENTTSLAVSGGFVGSAGNTQAWTLNFGGSFRLVRGRHALTIDEAFSYGRARLDINDPDTDLEDTVRNSVALARYDVFLTQRDALFASVRHRWDTFAGLDTRLQSQIGYLRNLYVAEDDEGAQTQRAWLEAGYDLTWDNLFPNPLPLTDDLAPADCIDDPDRNDRPVCNFDDTVIVHAARVFLGYDGKLSESSQLVLGLELLPALASPDEGENYDLRINADAAFRTTIFENLKLELKLRILHDTEPVPGALATDYQTLVSLIYSVR